MFFVSNVEMLECSRAKKGGGEELDLYLISSTKTNSKWIAALNIKPESKKSQKIIQEKMEKIS